VQGECGRLEEMGTSGVTRCKTSGMKRGMNTELKLFAQKLIVGEYSKYFRPGGGGLGSPLVIITPSLLFSSICYYHHRVSLCTVVLLLFFSNKT
jgi:hypothetical protein